MDNARGELLAGSYARVRFTDVKVPARLTLPSNALLFRAEGMQVGVVGADGRVTLRSIKLGRDFGRTVEVLEGLTAADRVILNPSDSLTQGARVRVQDLSKAAAKP